MTSLRTITYADWLRLCPVSIITTDSDVVGDILQTKPFVTFYYQTCIIFVG